MSKKSQQKGRSGNPAKRVHQAAVQKVTKAFDKLLDNPDYDEEVRAQIRFEKKAHTAVVARGWLAQDEYDHAGYMTEWSPSDDQIIINGDREYEPTYLSIVDDYIEIMLAGPVDGPFYTAKYRSIEDLLADIEALEAFRHGHEMPELPHAFAIIENSDSPGE